MGYYKIGTLVRRNKGYGVWSHHGKENYFTDIGEVIGVDNKTVKVRWPDGDWYKYDVPEYNLIIVEQPKKWSLPDELFEI
jgi:hypothetical protein